MQPAAGNVPRIANKGFDFLHVHAFEPATLGRGDLHRAGAFDQYFARFPLRSLETDKRCLRLRCPLIERSIEIRN